MCFGVLVRINNRKIKVIRKLLELLENPLEYIRIPMYIHIYRTITTKNKKKKNKTF